LAHRARISSTDVTSDNSIPIGLRNYHRHRLKFKNVVLTWLTITLFTGRTWRNTTTASSLLRLVRTEYRNGSVLHALTESTMMTTLSNPIRFHASAVKGNKKLKSKDTLFMPELVANTAYFRFGLIFPNIAGAFLVSHVGCSLLLVTTCSIE